MMRTANVAFVVLFMLVLPTSGSASAHGTWREIPPPSRALHSMVYDSKRHRLLVFGGTASAERDLWDVTLTGAPVWTLLQQEGEHPPPLLGHSAIYDPTDDRMIIFGGLTPEGLSSMVYALELSNGQRWVRLNPRGLGPEPRAFHSAIFDPEHEQMVVYGGEVTGSEGTAAASAESWILRLGRTPHWKRLHNRGDSPGALSRHAAVLDTKRARMLVFGHAKLANGATSSAVGLWSMAMHEPRTWSHLDTQGSVSHTGRGSPLIYDPVRDQLVVFSGYGPSEAYALDLTAEVWRPIGSGASRPVPRDRGPAIYDPVGDRMVIHGGVGTVSILRDSWALDLGDENWSPLGVADAGPAQMEGQAVAYDPLRERMIVYGGWATRYLNEAWALSLSDAQQWTRLGASGPQPDGRVLPSIAYDPTQDRILMFGGLNQSNHFNDVWSLDMAVEGQWQEIPGIAGSPGGAHGHSAVFDPLRNRMVVYGISIWLLHLGATPVWELLPPSESNPGPRYTHAAFYDSKRDRMIVHGGADATRIRSDVWALDMTTLRWSQLAGETTDPRARNAHAAIWDEQRDRMVVWGGLNAGRSEDAWAFSLTDNTWSKLSPVGQPPPGRGHGLGVYDVARDRMVIFGGETYGGIWALEWSEAQPVTADRQATRATGSSRNQARFTIGANPVVRALTITISDAGPVRVEVFDIGGRCVVRRRMEQVGVGSLLLEETEALPAGVYVVRLSGESWSESRRVCFLR